MLYKVHNSSMRNAIVSTSKGVVKFNNEGIANRVPMELAEEWSAVKGFKVTDENDKSVVFGKTAKPKAEKVIEKPIKVDEPSKSLPNGWTAIDGGGYTIESDNTTFTLTGINSPDEVSIDNKTFHFDKNVKTEDIHLIGAAEGDTVYVGEKAYTWSNTDGNKANGLEITPKETKENNKQDAKTKI